MNDASNVKRMITRSCSVRTKQRLQRLNHTVKEFLSVERECVQLANVSRVWFNVVAFLRTYNSVISTVIMDPMLLSRLCFLHLNSSSVNAHPVHTPRRFSGNFGNVCNVFFEFHRT